MKPRLSKASNKKPERNRRFLFHCISGVLVLCWSGILSAAYKDDVGYTALQAELGANIPDGSGYIFHHNQQDQFRLYIAIEHAYAALYFHNGFFIINVL